jgi:hypothetical protein
MDLLDSLLLLVPSIPYAIFVTYRRIFGPPLVTPRTGLAAAGPYIWSLVGLLGLAVKQRLHAARRARRIALGDQPDRADELTLFQRNFMGLWLNPCVLLIWAALTAGQPLVRSAFVAPVLRLRPLWARAAAIHVVLAMLAIWLGAGRSAPPKGTRRTLAIALFLLGLRSRFMAVLTPASLQFVLGKAAPTMKRSASFL